MKKLTSRQKIKKITQLSLFLAIGIILSIIESMIPLPIPVPGVRLGLANIVGLVVLYFYSPKEYVGVSFLRVILVGLLRTGLFSVAFLLSLSGWALCTIGTLILYFIKKFSIYGISVVSSLLHGVGQMITVMIIYSSLSLILYLPILMISGVITGFLTAFIASMFLEKVAKHIKFLNC